MKKPKAHIIAICILIGGLGVFILSALFEKRDPKKILVQYSKNYFDVSLQPIIDSIDITYFKEQWCGNGDGECMIRFKYKVNEDFFQNFHDLPIETSGNSMFLDLSHGYYLYHGGEYAIGDYGYLIFNTDSLTGVLYYQIQ